MTNEFAENNKFFGLDGTINRRNFIANFIIVEIVEALIFATPFMFMMFANPDMMSSIFSVSQTAGFPRWVNLWSFGTGLVELALIYPSIVRRVRDITGNSDNNNQVFAIILILLLTFNINKVFNIAFLQMIVSCLAFFILLSLMMVKGKISGERPKDELIKFNWGAMFGTWIWGLINKSYLTLFAIPLFFTTAFLPFMILCGIKGNEWAYKDTDKPIEEFHKSQSNQTAIFSAIMPVIFIVGMFIAAISGVVALGSFLQKNPKAMQKFMDYSANVINVSVESRYSNIEFTDDEYKFYLDPVIWSKMPLSAKKNQFDVTKNYVLMRVYPNYDKMPKDFGYVKEYRKIKIYSTFNNELLAQYDVDEAKLIEVQEKYKKREISFKEFAHIVNSGYKFNENPTLP